MRSHFSSLLLVDLFQGARKMVDFMKCSATHPLAIVGVLTVLAQNCLAHGLEDNLTVLFQVKITKSEIPISFVLFLSYVNCNTDL